MSLINLLTVGATFKGVKDSSGSYKLGAIAPIPKFNANKPAPTGVIPPREATTQPLQTSQGSLFIGAPEDAPVANQDFNPIKPQEVTGAQTQAGRSSSPLGEGSESKTDLPANIPLGASEVLTTPVPTRVEADCPAAQGRHVAVNPTIPEPPAPGLPKRLIETQPTGLKRLIHRFFGARPVRPAATAPVQIELALDKVTVVRNDLSDESWPGDSRTQMDRGTTVVDASPRAGAWFNLTARFGKQTPAGNAKPGGNATEEVEPEMVARM